MTACPHTPSRLRFRLRVEAASSFRQTGASAAVGAVAPLAAAYGVGAYAGAAGAYQQPVDYGAAAAGYAAQPAATAAPAYGAPPGPPPGPPTAGAQPDAGYNPYAAAGGHYDPAVGQKRPRVGEPGGPEPQTVAEVDEALAALAAQKVRPLHQPQPCGPCAIPRPMF